MKETVFTLASPVDSLPLSCLLVEPDGEVRAAVVMSHGIMEHKERFLPLMRRFAEFGFACAMNDQRGNGQSVKNEDDLGFTYGAGAEGILRDMRCLAEYMARRYPTKKQFLFGHSLGALCCMNYMKRWGRDVNGAILSSLPAESANAAVGAGKAYIKVKKRFKGAHFRDENVVRLMTGNYASKFAGETSPFCWLCSDPARVAEYEADPLCGRTYTLDGCLAVLDLMDEAYDAKGWENVSNLCPVFISVGAEDPCAEGEKGAAEGERFLKKAGLLRTEHRSYERMRHEILNEPDAEKPVHDIINRLVAWL